MSNPETDKVRCVVVGETAKAYSLRDGNDETRVAWFPKSEISFERRNIITGVAVAEIPLWLLEAKGWNQ